MSDLVVNIPTVTITAKKPKLTTREDFIKLKRYANAFRRGEVSREQVPFKYRVHLSESASKLQDSAYKQYKTDLKKRTKPSFDTSTPGDGFIEELMYNIGSQPGVVNHGTAGISNFIVGLWNTVVGNKPYTNRNLAAFLETPEKLGYVRTDDNRGPQFTKALKGRTNINTYKGVINPYNEYVVFPSTYEKFYNMAKTGDIYYSNADIENIDHVHNDLGIRERGMIAPMHGTSHRDDVQHYPIQFYIKDGELFANAADLQDYHGIQGRILSKFGNPYILRQNDIPVRKIEYNFEPIPDIYDVGTRYDYDTDMIRASNMQE